MSLSEDWYQLAIKQFKINEISYGELSVSEEQILIGRGGFGHIYKTKCNTIGTVAIKEIRITLEDDKTCIKNFTRELKIHSRIEHGRIIKFYGISRNIDKGLYYLVLEYANQGNLREFLIKKRDFSFEWEERIRLAIQIAEGLRYLHETLNIAHRDLHTKNILINDGNIKISDFGLSKDLNSVMSSNNGFFGIVPFIDPQKLNNGKKFTLDRRSDIYSLGMVLWEISSCRIPFCEEDLVCLSLKICQGLKEKSIKGTPMDYIKIYTNCWQFEPDSRPLINQILLQLQSISLEPVFEGDEDDEFISPRSPYYTRFYTPPASDYSDNAPPITISEHVPRLPSTPPFSEFPVNILGFVTSIPHPFGPSYDEIIGKKFISANEAWERIQQHTKYHDLEDDERNQINAKLNAKDKGSGNGRVVPEDELEAILAKLNSR